MAAEKPYYELEDAEQMFHEFIQTYNKTYAHNAEKQKRLQIFKQNLKEINQLNAIRETVHGVTQFSDLTKEEFVNNYMGLLPRDNNIQNNCQVITDADITTNEAPDSLDYRQQNVVTEPKNQKPCQSCWIFSSIGSIESQYAIKHGQLISLSEQQLMDCLQCSRHCGTGGFMVAALSELSGLPGVESEADYTYAGKDLQCQFDQSKVKVQVTGCLSYNLRDENQLKESLYKYGPIAIAIYAHTLDTYQRGSIFDINDCPANKPDHGVLLVGYGTEGGKDFWIIKNSWGTSFGDDGYFRITRGTNTCNLVNSDACSPVVA